MPLTTENTTFTRDVMGRDICTRFRKHSTAPLPRQDRRTPGERRPVLLAPAGRGPSDTTRVCDDAPAHLGAAGADGLITVRGRRRKSARWERCREMAGPSFGSPGFESRSSASWRARPCGVLIRLQARDHSFLEVNDGSSTWTAKHTLHVGYHGPLPVQHVTGGDGQR